LFILLNIVKSEAGNRQRGTEKMEYMPFDGTGITFIFFVSSTRSSELGNLPKKFENFVSHGHRNRREALNN
jgi:hypothetical protein